MIKEITSLKWLATYSASAHLGCIIGYAMQYNFSSSAFFFAGFAISGYIAFCEWRRK